MLAGLTNDVKVTVLVRQYGDASLAIFDGPRCLARYDEHGQLPNETGISQMDSDFLVLCAQICHDFQHVMGSRDTRRWNTRRVKQKMALYGSVSTAV